MSGILPIGKNVSAPGQTEIEELQARLQEAEAVLNAIRHHEVDALVVKGPLGDQVYTLTGADDPYRVLVETMYEGAVTMVARETVFFCNRSFARLVHATEQQVLGAPIARFVTAEDQSEFAALVARAATGGAAGELHLLASDGTCVPVFVVLRGVNVDEVHGVCIVVTDLTEQKRNREIVAQERLARAILTQATEALVVCDTEDIIIRASERARELAGRDVIGLPFATAFPLQWQGGRNGIQAGTQRDSLRVLCSALQRRSGEAAYQRDGQVLHLLVSAGPLRGDQGEALGCVVSLADISERKRVEAALLESEARFRTALEHAPVPILLHTLDGEIIELNLAFTTATGYSRAEVSSGREWFVKGHRVPEDAVDDLLREVHLKLRAGTQEPEEVEVWTKWGESRRWLFHGSKPVTLPDGREAVISTAVDVTERRRAEEALRASEARFDLATRAARELIYDYDLASGTVWRSAGLAEVIGVRPEDAEPTAEWWNARIHPDDLARLEDEFKAVQASDESRNPTQYRVRNAEGVHVWVEDRPLIVRDDAGTVTRMVGSTVNIEARRRADGEIAASLTQARQAQASAEELRERIEQQARLFDAALSSIHDYVYIFDAKGRFVYANRLLLNLWGLGAEQALGRTMAQLGYSEDVQARLLEDIQAVLATGRPTTSLTTYTSATGAQGSFENVLAPVLDAGGAVTMVAGASRDVTERMRMERALKDSDRRKDEFIATLAHELRNPLAPIRYAVELLRGTAAMPRGAVTAIDMIDRHVRQLTRLVDDLLDVSRISTGKIVLKKEPLSVSQIVERAIEAARPMIESRRHRLDVALPPDTVWVEGDETRLTQILVNLLGNAAKYMEEVGQIRFEVYDNGGYVELRIIDGGMGIPPEMLGSVFDLFTQVDASLGRGTGGLGIGLNLVKQLVALHGGSVEAHSAGIGRGSKFVVRLPTIAPPVPTEPIPASAGHPCRPLRILVVDDNVDSADSMAVLLRIAGHQTATANSGPAAIEVALALQPDVLLLDIGLPGMDGYEVARRLRSMAQTRNVMLIAVTGYGQPEDHRRSQEAGFDHHLIKPVELETVKQILSSLISKP
jgi:PAS domain S-box-containing protein